MKRLITVITGCILLCYFAVTAGSVVSLVANKPRLRSACTRVRNYSGLTVLFANRSRLTGNVTRYRFYSAGQWQAWQELEGPLFKRYTETGSLGVLKHNRLDGSLINTIYTGARYKNIKGIKSSAAYKAFISHMIYAHCPVKKPDSLEVSYYEKHSNPDTLNLLLTFKDGL